MRKFLVSAVIVVFGPLAGCAVDGGADSGADEAGIVGTGVAVTGESSMAATYSSWQLDAPGPFSSIEKLIRPMTEPAREIFFSQQFWFQSGMGGYIGLQNAGVEKRAVFSIWNNRRSGAVFAQSPGVASTFDNEGSGWHTHIAFPWVADHIYRLRVAEAGPGAYGTTKWTGYVSDATAGGPDYAIGTIYMTWDTGRLGPSTTDFTEHFIPQASCADFGAGTAYFGAPSANGGAVRAGAPTNETQTGAFACTHVWTSVLASFGTWAVHSYAP